MHRNTVQNNWWRFLTSYTLPTRLHIGKLNFSFLGSLSLSTPNSGTVTENRFPGHLTYVATKDDSVWASPKNDHSNLNSYWAWLDSVSNVLRDWPCLLFHWNWLPHVQDLKNWQWSFSRRYGHLNSYRLVWLWEKAHTFILILAGTFRDSDVGGNKKKEA